jgi:hypothetical protein
MANQIARIGALNCFEELSSVNWHLNVVIVSYRLVPSFWLGSGGGVILSEACLVFIGVMKNSHTFRQGFMFEL